MKLEHTTTPSGFEVWQNDEIMLIRAGILDVIAEIDFATIGAVVQPDGTRRRVREDLSLAVFDPKMGRGDSAVLAVRRRRRYIGLETDPRSFERAVEMADQAILDRAGTEFAA